MPLNVVLSTLAKSLNWTPTQTETYGKRLAEIPLLQSALQDPLTLNLFIQSWDSLQGVDFSKLTCVGIYAIFVQHWLTTCQGSVPFAAREAIKGNAPDLERAFYLLAGTLDFDSYQKRLGSPEFELYTKRSFYDYFAARFLLQASQDPNLDSLVFALNRINRGDIRNE